MADPGAERLTALLCGLRGDIREVIRDDLNLCRRTGSFQDLVGTVDVRKAENFLERLRKDRAAAGWEINVPFGGQISALHFAGAMAENKLLIVASGSREELERINSELWNISNEQINKLRAATKEVSLHENQRLDELTRVNNELANLQREMARKNADLARLNERKNHVLGVVAHDLRGPLGAITTCSEFLEEEAASRLTPEEREFLEMIRSSSDFLLRMVEDLLDISAIESGSLQLKREPTDLPALIKRSVSFHAVLAEKKGIRVRFRAGARIPPVFVDPVKLEQVLNNLVGNAVKFSPPHSVVEATVREDGDNVVIAVSDQGPGIDDEDKEQIFEPFKKAKSGPHGEKGVGLGLAIASRIVAGHGGRIRVESGPGQGATFFVVLPVIRSS